MGGGSWDTNTYMQSSTTRAAFKVKDFAYTEQATKVHPNLDPMRINKKPFGVLESRDSKEHPKSTAVLITFDVTGSNANRAIVTQKKLPNLMEMLNKYLPDPQVAIAANDDYSEVRENCIQISDFESDNRVDDHIRSIWITNQGGGNGGESYELLLYAAARKMALDCVEKRGKKGYMFLYADEPMFEVVSKKEVKVVFGDVIEKDIPVANIIKEASEKFLIFMLWPKGGYISAREQFIKLFGKNFVIDLQDPNLICEQIVSTIYQYEMRDKTPDQKLLPPPPTFGIILEDRTA